MMDGRTERWIDGKQTDLKVQALVKVLFDCLLQDDGTASVRVQGDTQCNELCGPLDEGTQRFL